VIHACFADNAEIPIKCSHDIGEPWNCVFAADGIKKKDCPHWQPQRTIDLALTILGVKK
jgi:hypothetical protein